MARFDIFPNPIEEDRQSFPFVLEIQSDLLHRYVECVCVPLAHPDALAGLTDRFNPVIVVDGNTLRLHLFGIAVFHRTELRQSTANARHHTLEIETALDMLLRGY